MAIPKDLLQQPPPFTDVRTYNHSANCALKQIAALQTHAVNTEEYVQRLEALNDKLMELLKATNSVEVIDDRV